MMDFDSAFSRVKLNLAWLFSLSIPATIVLIIILLLMNTGSLNCADISTIEEMVNCLG